MCESWMALQAVMLLQPFDRAVESSFARQAEVRGEGLEEGPGEVVPQQDAQVHQLAGAS